MFKAFLSIIFIAILVAGITFFIPSQNHKLYYQTYIPEKSIVRNISSIAIDDGLLNYFEDYFFRDDHFRFYQENLSFHFVKDPSLNKRLEDQFKFFVKNSLKNNSYTDYYPNINFLKNFFDSLSSEFQQGPIQIQFHMNFRYNLNLEDLIKKPFDKKVTKKLNFKYLIDSKIPDSANIFQYIGGTITYTPRNEILEFKRFFKLNKPGQFNMSKKEGAFEIDFLLYKNESNQKNTYVTSILKLEGNQPLYFQTFFGLKDIDDQLYGINGHFYIRGKFKNRSVNIKVESLDYDYLKSRFSQKSNLEFISKNSPKEYLDLLRNKYRTVLIQSFRLNEVGFYEN